MNLNLLESIEYFYYFKNSGKKEENKKNNKGIIEIKKFIRELNLENIIRKMNKIKLVILVNINMSNMLEFLLVLFFI